MSDERGVCIQHERRCPSGWSWGMKDEDDTGADVEYNGKMDNEFAMSFLIIV